MALGDRRTLAAISATCSVNT